jgi:hypothetical protein
MANTYTLISSNVLSGSAANVTFSAIPSTYTDLVLRVSARENAGGQYPNAINLTFNGSSASNYSLTHLYAESATPQSIRYSNQPAAYLNASVNGSASISNTFSSVEIYISSYNATQNKTFSASSVVEANSTSNLVWTIGAFAGLRSVTDAITSITLNCGASFGTGSSFRLYGIKNS